MPLHVFRVAADGIHDVNYVVTGRSVLIQEDIGVVGIFIATTDKGLRSRMGGRHQKLLEYEDTIPFDPAYSRGDWEQLIDYPEK